MSADRVRTGWRARRGRWWWIAVLILVPVVLGSALSVALLLALVDATTAGDQIELIKTGLAVGAGTGGAVALVLAGRRQWSTEQAHQVAVQSATDARHDATERRITDLYSRAADQLGSDKAQVRLAGLYSLERLAQDTPSLRQTVVNLLCSYLRMPFHAPAELLEKSRSGEDVGDDQRASLQEIEVRRTVQRILATHLRPGGAFWPDIDLSLTGAVLHLFDMKDARVRLGAFGGVKFLGWTRFDGCVFDSKAIFGGARFERSASFRSVYFSAEARFRGAVFSGPAAFDDAVFAGEALFGGLRPSSGQPDGATFENAVTFTGATFARPAVFEHVRAATQPVDLPDSVELD